MSKTHDLAAIVNRVSEEDLAALAPNDIRVLLQGIPRQATDPAVTAACKKLAAAILRNSRQPPELDLHRLH